MRERLFVIVTAAALLVTVALPSLFSASIVPGVRANARQVAHEQVARAIFYAQCQSSHGCGG